MEVTYCHVSGTIEKVIGHYVYGKNVYVPDMSREDVAQEARFKAWSAISSKTFDKKKINNGLYSYVYRVIHNHIFNLRRGLTVPNNCCCNRCKKWNPEERTCGGNPDTCEKMQKYITNMRRKAALKIPVGFDTDAINRDQCNYDMEDLILEEYVLVNLPLDLAAQYNILKSGGDLPDEDKKNLEKVVIGLLRQEDV